MLMADLLGDVEVDGIRGDPATTEVHSVELDSRQVTPGALFCCVPGARTDGHRHAGGAVSRGATALLCEHFLELGVTQVRVVPGGIRPAMAAVASAFHGHPSRSLTTVGVTGTNGKTTVTQLVRAILEADGRATGVIGTLDGARTTPEAPALQAELARFVSDGKQAVAMEVSSHALDAHRVDGITFSVGAFTNLSREHLDHHGTMERYYAAKAALFDPVRCERAVVFVDDPWGARLAGELMDRNAIPVRCVRRAEAEEVSLSVGATGFRWRGRQVSLPLSGGFNVDNALVAAAVGVTLGVGESQVAAGLDAAPVVPGRMEVVPSPAPVAVLVDYAHTPAGLAVALDAARALADGGRVLCVFGCGGDRDPGKRPEMGAVASQHADVVILTSDNPRSEDPEAILDQVRAGIAPGTDLAVEPERSTAIRAAVDRARAGDVVLLAGKGHEVTQTVAGRTVPFDDRVEAAAALEERFGGSAT